MSLHPLRARRRTWNHLGCRVAAERGGQQPWKAGAQLDDAPPGPLQPREERPMGTDGSSGLEPAAATRWLCGSEQAA